jgi:phenylacetic acid degradation operon negative regulatory protein
MDFVTYIGTAIEVSIVDIKVNPYVLVFSLFGGYVVSRGVDIWTGSLIRALTPLGFSDRMVRTTISRMKHVGYLKGHRVGRRSFYRLTDSGLREVHGARDLAFGALGAPWDGGWVLVSYSFPENQRELRDSLRDSLKAIGFGCLMPGVWISPHPLPAKMEKRWQKTGSWPYLEIFEAKHIGPSEPDGFVSHAWPQLPALADRYRAFEKNYGQIPDRFRQEALDNEDCFVLHLQSLFEFMSIIIEDPALPPALLPEDWPRPAAQSLNVRLRQLLAEPAGRFFDEIYEATEYHLKE